jgi:hypothetical protein
MERITIRLVRDPDERTTYYRASDEHGNEGDSDHLRRIDESDVHAMYALAAQAVSRLGEKLEAAR